MQYDYYGLFRATILGLDRIAEANQITYGATTSIFDQRERERCRFALVKSTILMKAVPNCWNRTPRAPILNGLPT